MTCVTSARIDLTSLPQLRRDYLTNGLQYIMSISFYNHIYIQSLNTGSSQCCKQCLQMIWGRKKNAKKRCTWLM